MPFSNSESEPLTAVVLAGGDAADTLAASFGVPAKAHVPWRGQPLVNHVLQALADSAAVRDVVYVGSLPAGVTRQPNYSVPSGKRFSDSAALGLGAALAVAPGSRLLLVTGDLPWLSGGAIDAFARQASADLNYPVIRREVALEQFPEQQRTWVKLKQGQFTGGNLAVIRPEVVPDLLLLTGRFFAARKNPLALSSLLGVGTLFALLRGQADLHELEAKVSRLLGWSARAVIAEDASLGADVDRPGQLPPD